MVEHGIQELAEAFPFPKTAPDVPPSDHGWFLLGNRKILSGFLTPKTRIVVELGSWLGQSTRFIADHAPGAVVLAVDHWKGSSEHVSDPALARILPRLYETFIRSCWEYRNRIIPISLDTLEGLRLIHSKKLRPDLVYIDAAHEYEAVMKDFETTFDLFPDSQIVGDDWGFPDVRKAVGEVSEKRGIPIRAFENCWWVEKSV